MSVAARVPRARLRGGRALAGGGRRRRGRGPRLARCSPPATAMTPSTANDSVPLGTAAVERRDLVDREDVDGTLGFAAAATVPAPAAGTITRLRDEGDTVTRGRSLMSIDAHATAWVLYGTIPMYRDLGPGVSDGRDVRQLERNLKALGYDPGTVDDALDLGHDRARSSDFQDDRDLTESGTLARARGRRQRRGGARRQARAPSVGEPARAGAPVTTLTSTTPVVTAKLDAGLAAEVHRGDRVRITLPDGREVGGRVSQRRHGRRPPARTARRRRSSCASPSTVAATAASTGPRSACRSRPGARRTRSRCRSPRSSRRRRVATRSSSPVRRRLVGRHAAGPSPTTGSRSRARASRRARGWWCRDDASSLEDVTKEYPGGVRALDGVSLDGRRRRARRPSSGRRGRASRRCCTSWARSIARPAGACRSPAPTSRTSTTASWPGCARRPSASSSSSSS